MQPHCHSVTCVVPLLVSWITAACASQVRTKTNPLGQVITLLEDLSAKVIGEGEAEAQAYRRYYEWCADTAKQKEFEIKTATTLSNKLKAKIEQLSDEIKSAETTIEELSADIATASTQLANATAMRDQEAAVFATNEQELIEVLGQITLAAGILEEEMRKNPASLAQISSSDGTVGLLQALAAIVDATTLSDSGQKRLLALVQLGENSVDGDADSDEKAEDAQDPQDTEEPPQGAYKTHSGSILDLIQDLKNQAQEQLDTIRKTEEEAKHQYKVLKQSLENELAQANKDMDTVKQGKAKAEEDKGAAQGDLEVTTKELEAAKTTLEDTKTTCMQVASDYEATVKSRDTEVKSIHEAIQILNEVGESGAAASRTYSFLQKTTNRRHKHSNIDKARRQLVAVVKRLAKKHHSAALNQLASRILDATRSGNPFAKVTKLMRDMISRLEEEAASEQSEKEYCDHEMSRTEEKKAELNVTLTKLKADIEKAVSDSATLKEEVRDIQTELQWLEQDQKEADEARREGHANFMKAKHELEQGILGVRQAIKVLRDYYAKDDGDVSLLQDSSKLDAAMEQPSAPARHLAAGSMGSSIIGILEQIETDFSANLAKEQTEEDAAEEASEQAKHEAEVEKTAKEQDVKYKTKEIASLEKTISELSSDSDTKNAELSAVLEYYEKLKERCVKKAPKYEEVKRRRRGEINGLEQALAALRVAEDEANTTSTAASSFLARAE